ncbi:hypothetical protein GH140_00125 [bacterium]|nr:hypothetical protein [bacterium]
MHNPAFELLQCYGIPAVKTVKVKKEEQLGNSAEKVGYPLVLKVDSEKIVHKTEVGGASLNCTSFRISTKTPPSPNISVGSRP